MRSKGTSGYGLDIRDTGTGIGRRRLLGAGIAGTGVALVAPRLVLDAIASDSAPPEGLVAAAVDVPTGKLVGLLTTADGAAVHTLHVGATGAAATPVQVGRRLRRFTIGDLDAVGHHDVPVALHADAGGVAVLAVERLVDAAAPARSGDPVDRLVRTVLDAEPGSPLTLRTDRDATNTAIAPVRIGLDRSRSRIAPHGVVAGSIGAWIVRQHGPDDEADHLDTLTVTHAGRRLVSLGGLDHTAAATLGGHATDAVVTLSGSDQARFLRLRNGAVAELPALELPALDLPAQQAPAGAGGPSIAATVAGATPMVAIVDDGGVSVRALVGARWQTVGAPSVPGARAVTPIAGAAAVLVDTPDGLVQLDPAGAH